ncbi:MAG: hypothetical protein KIT43_02070 [Bauldia sp.]|nr:hypothetical protein [Bauldia sp.]MCW5718921.1 hypothetical protein [Bauldia sp.]
MLRPSLVLAAGWVAIVAMATPTWAITVTPAGWAQADATIGEDVIDDNDIVVKPCDCEPVANPGVFRVYNSGGSLVRVHWENVEGTTITTTDGTAVGTVLSVQNDGRNQILLIVGVEGGVLGAVDRIAVRRNAFYWTGSAAVIDTTLADLRSSIQAAGVGV